MIRVKVPGIRRVIAIAAMVCLPLTMISFSEGAGGTSAPGTFLGSDLLTENAVTAAAFYGELFGWDVEKVREDSYAIHHQGRLIASVSRIDSADNEVNQSLWLVGIAVADLDRAMKAAGQLGAEVREPVTTVEGYGRFAVIADPQGAPVMLIEPGSIPIGGTTGHGSWVWAELWTRDVDAAADFYAKVIGYSQTEVERRDEKYHVFKFGEELRAGLVKIPKELENVKPGWAAYVGVENLAKTMARVRELGGRVIFASEDNPVRGAVALIAGPAGAVLFVHEIGSAKEVSE
jgi:predicted enzyme related to lactoylglutathione lyase